MKQTVSRDRERSERTDEQNGQPADEKKGDPETLTERDRGGPESTRTLESESQTVKMDWELMTMASLHLTATEHRYYGDIFIYCCENAESDSVPVIKVAELLRFANLPRDVMMKVEPREFI